MNMGSGSIFLQQDITNSPNAQASFSGTLDGLNFIASSSNVGNVLLPSCLFRSSTLNGHFSPNFSTFDATGIPDVGLAGRGNNRAAKLGRFGCREPVTG